MKNLLSNNDLWRLIRRRMGRNCGGFALLVGIACVGPSLVSSALAQDRDREERREERGDREDRGGGDRRERGGEEDRGERRGFDPKDFLTRMDENKNGVLDPNEISGRARGFLARAAEQAGISLDQPVPLDKMIAAMSASQGERSSRDDSSSRGSSSSSRGSSSAPLVPGFGDTATEAPKAFGFNVPLSTAPNGVSLDKQYDPRVIEYVARMLNDYDKNKDGVVDSDEWKSGRWSSPPEESDTNKDNRLDRKELCDRIAKRFGWYDVPGRISSVVSTGAPAPASSSGSSSGGPPSSTDLDRFKRYAEGMMKQYDKNKDGMLQKDEWSEMRGDPAASDTNKDSVLTLDELTARMANYSTGRSDSQGDPRDRSGRSGDSSKSDDATKTYRMLSATERLPKGLPDWFTRNDADGDGQILMAEYTAAWSEAMALEFARIDANGDGVITPAECLAAEGSKKSGSSSSSRSYGASSGGPSSAPPAGPPSGGPGSGGGRFGPR